MVAREIRRDWLRALLVVEGDKKVHEVFAHPLLSRWTRTDVAIALDDLHIAGQIVVWEAAAR